MGKRQWYVLPAIPLSRREYTVSIGSENTDFRDTQSHAIDSVRLMCYNSAARGKGGARMDGEQIRCGELFKRISEAMEKHGNSELQSYGVTFVQMQVLMELNSLPEGTATLKELEKRFDIAQSTAAGIAARREKKQLVASFRDGQDLRIKHIRITDAGREQCRVARESMDRNEARLLSSLEPGERAEFVRLLLKVCENLPGD